jgi:uracil-DNA glycosylase
MNIDPQLGGQSDPGKSLISCPSCRLLTTVQAAVPGIRLPGAPGMIIGADPAMTTNVTWSFVGRE